MDVVQLWKWDKNEKDIKWILLDGVDDEDRSVDERPCDWLGTCGGQHLSEK